jgi:hypothetical protein
MNEMLLGIDAGNGAFKLYGQPGALDVLSQVALNGTQHVTTTLGLKKRQPPMKLVNDFGSFYVGGGAHDYGRPVENLDVDRFNGSPEMQALLHGALTRYQQEYYPFDAALNVVVGLPNSVLAGESAEGNIEAVKKWMRTGHTWSADGMSHQVTISEVKVASQATGALFDFLLDEGGAFYPERKMAFTKEVGVISIGFGTVELMVVRNREMVERFTGGATSGVRRLLELCDPNHFYSLGELDLQLRAGTLETRDALPLWERDVMSVVEKQWGRTWQRFQAVLIVGGGALLLKDLPYKFQGKGYVLPDPVHAIARGLYKLAVLNTRRK